MSKEAYFEYLKQNKSRTDVDPTDPEPVKAILVKLERNLNGPKAEKYQNQITFYKSVLEYMTNG
jgi:hypothetical protein